MKIDWHDAIDEPPQANDEYFITWSGELGNYRTRRFIEIAEYDHGEWIIDHIIEKGYKNIKVHGWDELPDPYEY